MPIIIHFFFFLHLHPLFLIVAFTVIIITVLPLPLQKAIVNQSTWVRESVRGFFGMNSVELNICSAVGLSLSERVKLSNAKRAKSSELFPFFFNKFVKKGKKCKRIWEEEEVKKYIFKSLTLMAYWFIDYAECMGHIKCNNNLMRAIKNENIK